MLYRFKNDAQPHERNFFVRGPRIGVPDILELGRTVRIRALRRVVPHVHDRRRLEVVYLTQGRRVYTVEGRTYRLRGGDVLVVRPGEYHGAPPEAVEDRAKYYFLVVRLPDPDAGFLGLSGDGSRRLRQALLGIRHRRFRAVPSLEEHLETAIALFPRLRRDRLARPRIENALAAFLMDVVACASAQDTCGSAGRLAPVLEHIERNLSDPLDIGKLSALVGLSPGWFKEVFKRETGFTPSDYLRHRQMERAEAELAGNPNRGITGLAMELGFSSSQYFATVFKRYTGRTPAQCRTQAERPRADRASAAPA